MRVSPSAISPAVLKRNVKRALPADPRVRTPVALWKSRGLRDSDVLLASYPRSGSTWLRFMLYEIFTGGESEFGRVLQVIPYLGKQESTPPTLPEDGRMIKSHESRSFGPAQALYVVRDPRSVALSQYSYSLRRGFFDGDLDEFVERFVQGTVSAHGSWGSHVAYWTRHPRLLSVVRYEDLRKDPKAGLSAVVQRLGLSVPEEKLEAVIAHHTLERMKEKEDRSPFKDRPARPEIRHVNTGAVDSWRTRLQPAQSRLIMDSFRSAAETVGYSD